MIMSEQKPGELVLYLTPAEIASDEELAEESARVTRAWAPRILPPENFSIAPRPPLEGELLRDNRVTVRDLREFLARLPEHAPVRLVDGDYVDGPGILVSYEQGGCDFEHRFELDY
jgi:hypothetical protein